MDCICISKVSFRGISRGKIRNKNVLSSNAAVSCVAKTKIRPISGYLIGASSKLKAHSKVKPSNTHYINLFALNKKEHNFAIKSKYSFTGCLRSRLRSSPEINVAYTDKLGGSFDVTKYLKFNPKERIYPTADIIVNSGNNYFVSNLLSTQNLYANVDEGIFSPSYDNKTTFIQPSSIKTEGNFKYQFGTSTLRLRPRESFLLFRASAPLADYSSQVAPVYKLTNIYLEDPSGNLIIKYKDFTIRGDADYSTNYVNFGTYISEPEINNAKLNTWEAGYPILSSGSSSNLYKLNIDFEVDCVGHQFTDGYDLGYQSGCVLPSSIVNFNVPNNSLRITAIELCNSGELFTYNSRYVPLYTEVSSTGLRLKRNIYPDKVLQHNFDNGIYPDSDSTWRYVDDSATIYDNNSKQNENILSSQLRNDAGSIKLLYSSISDSGKLQLRFAHEPPEYTFGNQNGAFNFSTTKANNSFSIAEWSRISHDHFFIVDKIDLKVIAKKAAGSRDYYLDVVGYSDDKLLNITSAVGGFLQNDSGINSIGIIPQFSGFNPTNELSIAGEPLSQKSQYFTSNQTNNAGGDHYLLTNVPLINSTSFQEYTIPLKIYKDNVALGESTDYSMSSYFEQLYLDIYPIPSGAEISRLYLVVHYKPCNALSLHTIGQPSINQLQRRELYLTPNSDTINASGSLINNLPHGYSRDNTFKSNYSTRWKGVTGDVVAGPFDPLGFDFSFENPEMITPFLNGYFSFNHNSGNVILSDYYFNNTRLSCAYSGIYIGNYAANKLSNVGLRFNSDIDTTHKTIDWTRKSQFNDSPLYGKISDNFENAIRVSGSNACILFNNVDTSGAFAIYTKFSPAQHDPVVYLVSETGDFIVDENNNKIIIDYPAPLYSGILFNKTLNNFTDTELAVGLSGGKLYGCCRNRSNNLITIYDNKYYFDYNYPLPIMLSYNENDNKLRLYTTELVAESPAFIKHSSSNAPLIFGSGIDGFITNIGISTLNAPSGHIISSGINILSSGIASKRLKQQNYSSLHDSLYSKIDDDIRDWHLGDFSICSFNQGYDRFTGRVGSDFIIHAYESSGSPYSSITNMVIPSSVNSNVSYHTQIENDSLRFNLSDASSLSSPFYFADSRISKTLPRGYQFEKEAICVDTILQYETNNDIVWDDGSIGPQLIISLYTPNKEPETYPTFNYGLVTRDVHHLKPSGCWKKITSTFNFNNLLDDSETWRSHNKDQYLKEFNHNYFSKDIDDMFLQYDLVYPSGAAFKSSLKIHSANVRLKNAFISTSGTFNNLNLQVSGKAIAFDNLNLCTPYTFDVANSSLNLSVSGKPMDSGNNNVNLYTSGVFVLNDSMPLHTISIGSINNLNGGLFGSVDPNIGFNLYCSGQLFEQQRLPLFTANDILDQSASDTVSLFTLNRLLFDSNIDSLNLYSQGFDGTSVINRETFNLYTEVTNVSVISTYTNLFVQTVDILPNLRSGICNLFTVNVPILNVQLGNQIISWNSKNAGVNIKVDDNKYASLLANDEIRGVDLMCYGECK